MGFFWGWVGWLGFFLFAGWGGGGGGGWCGVVVIKHRSRLQFFF